MSISVPFLIAHGPDPDRSQYPFASWMSLCSGMSKRRKTCADTAAESVDESTPSSQLVSHRTDRRFCQHCNEYLSLKTYQFHKRLYYDKVLVRICLYRAVVLISFPLRKIRNGQCVRIPQCQSVTKKRKISSTVKKSLLQIPQHSPSLMM